MRLLKASQTGSVLFLLMAFSQMAHGFFLKTYSLYGFASVRGSSWGYVGERAACNRLLMLCASVSPSNGYLCSAFTVWNGFHTPPPVDLKVQSYRYTGFWFWCVSVPKYKGMDRTMGVVLGGEVTSEPCFLAMLKPRSLFTDFFNLVLYTHPIFPLTDFQYKHFERSQSTGNTSRKHFPNFPKGPGHPLVV